VFVSAPQAALAATVPDGRFFAADTEYLQKRSVKYSVRDGLPAGAVDSVAACAGAVFAGTESGIYLLKGERWERVSDAAGIARLGCIKGRLYAAAKNGFYAVPPDAPERAERLYAGGTGAFAPWRDGFLIAPVEGEGALFLQPGAGEPKPVAAFSRVRVRIFSTDNGNRIWAVTDNGLASFIDNKLTYVPSADGQEGPLSNDVRDIFSAPDGTAYFATPQGISVFKQGRWSSIVPGIGGLPYGDVTAVAADGGTVAAGFSIGAARLKDGEWQYFQSGRWLPHDRVRSVAIAPDGTLWFGTDSGAGKIEYLPFTLLKKAEYFSPLVSPFLRRGFVGDAIITSRGDFSSIKTKTHDNENVWTGMLLGAECFRYAVTRDPEAKRRARASLDGMLFLQTVTGEPGFFARSFAAADEDHGKGGEWHPSADGKWMWKGDTSSDEAVGRFFGFSIYYDLCADDSEKKVIADDISRTMNRIIDDDYFLLDIDGKPTMWGLWNPFYLATQGKFQKNLNSLEILMLLKVAGHVSGDPRFESEYRRLIDEYGYGRNTINAKIHMPKMQNHSDDLLAFLSYYPLLQYEKDPKLLDDYYYKSIRRTWKIVREKKNPLWNYIYGASVPGDDFDAEASAWFLRRLPLDLIYWSTRNSQRADLPKDYNNSASPEELQTVKPLPPDESFMLKYNENPYRLDNTYWDGTNAEVPTFYLLPYWMGRYFGFIR